MRASTAVALIAGLLAPFACAAPTPTKVLVPGGYRLSTSVHEVPEGGSLLHVGSDVHVLDSAGNVLKVVTPTATTVKAAVDPEETGWVAYAYWLNTGTSPISSFTSTWTVPAAPKSNIDQTIFLFNSIEPNSGDAILQPVLQYGPSSAGGGSFWALATWYLVGSEVFFSKLVDTSVGATLDGVITLTSSSGSSYNYVSSFSNVAGTSLTVTGAAELTWATETLEVYGVETSSDFPAGSTVFSDINLELSSGTPTVSWTEVSNTEDGLTTKVTVDGATNAEITITY